MDTRGAAACRVSGQRCMSEQHYRAYQPRRLSTELLMPQAIPRARPMTLAAAPTPSIAPPAAAAPAAPAAHAQEAGGQAGCAGLHHSPAASAAGHSSSSRQRAAPPTPQDRQLTRAIQGCQSWRQLQLLHQRHAAQINHVHTCCLLETLRKLAPLQLRLQCPEEQQELAYFVQQLEGLAGGRAVAGAQHGGA